jgi:hypothetical protein
MRELQFDRRNRAVAGLKTREAELTIQKSSASVRNISVDVAQKTA